LNLTASYGDVLNAKGRNAAIPAIDQITRAVAFQAGRFSLRTDVSDPRILLWDKTVPKFLQLAETSQAEAVACPRHAKGQLQWQCRTPTPKIGAKSQVANHHLQKPKREQ